MTILHSTNDANEVGESIARLFLKMKHFSHQEFFVFFMYILVLITVFYVFFARKLL